MNLMTPARRLKYTGLTWLEARRRRRHNAGLPPVSERDRWIVEALEKEGACVMSLDALGIPGTAAMLQEADEAFAAAASTPRKPGSKSYIAALPHELVERSPALFSWGLSERILAIAEHYIGRPVFYRGLVGRRDLADGQEVGTRLFHLDYEDNRIMKVIVYLNDVDEDGGPFEFVPRNLSPWHDQVRFVEGRVPDEDMDRLVPRVGWKACVGKAGTVLFADPCTIFHRGRVPLTGDRRTLFYAYNSKTPRVPDMAGPIVNSDAVVASLSLTPAQRSALEWPFAEVKHGVWQ
jgi:hypothetical protein